MDSVDWLDCDASDEEEAGEELKDDELEVEVDWLVIGELGEEVELEVKGTRFQIGGLSAGWLTIGRSATHGSNGFWIIVGAFGIDLMGGGWDFTEVWSGISKICYV